MKKPFTPMAMAQASPARIVPAKSNRERRKIGTRGPRCDAPRGIGRKASTDAERARGQPSVLRHGLAADPLAQSMAEIFGCALSCGTVQELLNGSVRMIAQGLIPSHCLIFELASGQRAPKRFTAIGWERVTHNGMAMCIESIGGRDFARLTGRVDDERGEYSKFVYRQRIAPSGAGSARRCEDPDYGLLVARRYGTTWLGIIAGSRTPRDGYRATSVAFLKSILDILSFGIDRIDRPGGPVREQLSRIDVPSTALARWRPILPPYEIDLSPVQDPDGQAGWGGGQAALEKPRMHPFDTAPRDFDAELSAARAEEKKRIARELHDGVNQRLFVVKLLLDGVRGSLDGNFPAQQRGALDSAAQEIKNAIDEIRGIAAPEKTTPLGQACLVTRLRRLCTELEGVFGGTRVELETNLRQSTIDESLKATIFRITQEALHNAAKYSGAARVVVGLFVRDDHLHLTVRDDGRGFDCSDLAGRDAGSGIRGMKERVESSGGFLLVTSRPCDGTAIDAGWPLAACGAAVMSFIASTAQA